MAARKRQPSGMPALIRAAVAYSGWTQTQVAAQLNGVSDSALGRWSRGSKEGAAPEAGQLDDLARVTGVPPAFFRLGFQPIEAYDEKSAEISFGGRMANLEQIVMGLAQQPTTDEGRTQQDVLLRGLGTLLRIREASQPSETQTAEDALGGSNK
jgi:transcriptional regulator with XRE-family HTH domain